MNSDLLELADRDVGVTDPSLAVGLNDIAFYSTELPFINVLKQSGDRANNDGSWSVTVPNADGTSTVYDYSEAAHAGFLDDNGYIQNLPDGASATLTLFNGIPEEAGTGGRYVFFYEGEGDFSFVGANVVESLSEPGRIVLDIEDGSSFLLSLTDVDDQDHLRELSLVREEHVDLYEAGATFNPDFIDLFEDHRVLRFMDFQETNNSNHIEFSDLATEDAAFYGIPANQSYEYFFAKDVDEFTSEQLSELPRGEFTIIYVDPQTGEPFRDEDGAIRTDVPTDVLPAGIPTGVPISVLVDLANQVGADPWFNIPAQASDDYVRQFAEYVRDNLDPNLQARFEYSNEVWNGQFEQFTYANEKGLELFGDEFGDFPVNYYYGYRSAQILDIVNDVFGDEAPTRVNGVLSTQTVNIGVLDQSLLGVQRYIADNERDLEVNDLFDTVAVTGYFGPVLTEGSIDFPGHLQFYRDVISESIERFENGETSSQYQFFIDQIAQDLRDGSVTQAYFQDALDNGQIQQIPTVFSVNDLRELFAANREIADQFGLTLDQYEGGSHILTSSNLFGDTQLLDFLGALNDSSQIAEIQSEALIAFREEGGVLANDFIGVAQRSQFGPFGTLEHLNDTSELFDVFQDFNDNASSTTDPFGDQAFASLNELEGRAADTFVNSITELGGVADDTLIGGRQDDFLIGGAGDDVLVAGVGEDSLNGGIGFDTVVVSGAVEDYWLSVDGDGYRLIRGDSSDFILNVEAISFEDGESVLVETFLQGTSSFIDYFGGGAFTASRLFDADNGMQGVSIIIVDPLSATGSDLAFSPSAELRNVDNVYYVINGTPDQQTRSIVESGAANVQDSVEFISNVGEILGSDFDDNFEGHQNGELVDLGAGNDTLNGFGGNDTLSGGNGNDLILGGEGDDVLSDNNGLNIIDGGEGLDVFVFSGPRSDIDFFQDEGGFRLIGAGSNSLLINVELVAFEDGQSVFVGDLLAGIFDDVFYFGGGTYQATSDNGFNGVTISPILSNTVTGDELGITGEDVPLSQVVYYVSQRDNAAATFEAISDNGIATAASVADIVSSVGAFVGTDFDDDFSGSSADETVNLAGGNDRLSGFAGNDHLDGGAGDDFLGGGLGDDILVAGLGDDILNGGFGDDVVILSGQAEDYIVTVDGNSYIIEGVDGVDRLFDVERIRFADGQEVLLADWSEANETASADNDPDEPPMDEPPAEDLSARNLEGEIFQSLSTLLAGISIGVIDIEGATFAELGFDPNVGFTSASDIVFFVSDRDNGAASFEAINGGLQNALATVELIHNFSGIVGTQFNDFFSGSFADETVDLGAGDDRLDGFGGNDNLSGNDGNDFLGGGFGDDTLFGGSGDDVLNGGEGDDLAILTGNFNDYTIVENSSGTGYIVNGIDGSDSLFGVERIQFTNGAEILLADWVINDVDLSALSLNGGEYFAGQGNAGVVITTIDLEGQTARDLGFDRNDPEVGFTSIEDTVYSISRRDNVAASFEAINGGIDSALEVSDIVTNVGSFVGSDRDDIFTGSVGDEIVNLGEGDDRLDGFGGNDTLSGGAGDDFVGGGSGDDLLIGGAGADVLNGGLGNDTVSYADALDAIVLNLADGAVVNSSANNEAAGDQLFGIETIIATNGNDFVNLGDNVLNVEGGRGDDELLGGAGDNTLLGEFGNDTLRGFGGADVFDGGVGFDSLFGGDGNDLIAGGNNADNLFGELGDDTLNGDQGFDRLFGGEGNDALFGGDDRDVLFGQIGQDTLHGEDGNDVLFGNAGHDLLFGGEGNDRLNGNFNRDTLFGGNGDDTLLGGAGANELFGEDGDDLLTAGSGNDIFDGGDGNDHIIGFAGFDTITGGAGDDILEGRFNADTFVFADGFGNDVIRDFDALNDNERIDLSEVSGIENFEDLLNNHLDVDENGVVTIRDEGDSILLEGVDVADLDSADFIF